MPSHIDDTATGIQTLIGVGRELTYGTPVMAQKLLDRKSGGLEITFQDPDHESLQNITTDLESVPGTSKVAGTIKHTVTPEGLTRAICALLGDPTTVTTPAHVSGGPNDPAIPAFYTHTWLDTPGPRSAVTINEQKGPLFICHPGSVAAGLTVSIDKTQNTPIEWDMEYMSLNQLHYPSLTALGLDTAGMDPLPAFGPSQAQVSIAGAVTDDAQKMALAFKNNTKSRDVLNLFRGPTGFYKGKTDLTLTLDMFFSTDAEMKVFFGVLDAQATPYGASKRVRTVPFQTMMQSELNANNYLNQFFLICPRCSYKKVGQAVNGPDEIKQAVELRAYHDPGTGSCFKLQAVNGETHAAIIAPGTAVTAVPANGVQPLVV